MTRASAFGRFVVSLSRSVPIEPLAPAVRGLWHALRGEWDAAHEAVQPDDVDCAWVHAALHREEGDIANADHWYRQASRRRAGGSARDEYLAIARELLERDEPARA